MENKYIVNTQPLHNTNSGTFLRTIETKKFLLPLALIQFLSPYPTHCAVLIT